MALVELPEHLAPVLQATMAYRGHSQEDVARFCHTTQQTVCRWLAGSRPRPYLLQDALLRYLNAED